MSELSTKESVERLVDMAETPCIHKWEIERLRAELSACLATLEYIKTEYRLGYAAGLRFALTAIATRWPVEQRTPTGYCPEPESGDYCNEPGDGD